MFLRMHMPLHLVAMRLHNVEACRCYSVWRYVVKHGRTRLNTSTGRSNTVERG